MTEPTNPGVPATPVSADVPADEPVAPPPAPAAPPPYPAQPPAAPPPYAPAQPAVTPPAAPPPPLGAPPAAPAAPAAPPAVPAVSPPASPPAAPPATTPPPTETLDAGLAGSAATTTELAPHPAVPEHAASSGATPAPEATPDTVRSAKRRGMLVGAAAAGVPLLALGAFLYARGPLADARADSQADDRRAAALEASRQLALNLVSIDYKNLDRDLQRISESTTGRAREEFDQKILQNASYKQLVRENQAVITSKVERIGLERCGTDDAECRRGDKAVVLVFLDQESRNKLRKAPRVDRNRVALTVVRRGDRWLVSEVKVV